MVKITTGQTPGWDGLAHTYLYHLYHWAFMLRSLKHWFDAEVASPWKMLEQELVHPLRLQGVAFSGLKHKKFYSQSGPIVSYIIQTMVNVEKYTGFKSKWHKWPTTWHIISIYCQVVNHSFHNYGLNMAFGHWGISLAKT